MVRNHRATRLMLLSVGAIGAALLFLGGAIGMGGSPYTAGFAGSPAGPLALESTNSSVLANFDVAVHSRDTGTWYQPEAMAAAHGADCGAPPATHTVSTYQDSVFQCKDHIMTAIKAGGYGEIVLTPNQIVDFSGGDAVISFDVSTLRTSGRDFIDFWITPYQENVQLPFDEGDVDLEGTPKDAIHIYMPLGTEGVFKASVIRNFVSTDIPGNWWTGYESFLKPDAARRDTFQIKISQNHLSFGMPAYNFSWIDAPIPGGLSWNQGVFQFAQHSYNPTKDDGCGVGVLPCTANTWHWDNVSINPAIPFTIIKADRRYIDSASQTLTFNSPAPAGSNLRFSGIGQIQVSLNGGPFQPATKAQSSFLGSNYHADHMSSYWMPIPAGIKSIQLKFAKDDWYQGPFIAKDFAIWSTNGATVSLPSTTTPVTTTTATATATGQGGSGVPTTIRGTVDLEGRADDSGTIVSASPSNVTATTDASGSFVLTGLVAGQSYTIVARHSGYLPATKQNAVPPASGLTLPVTTLKAGDIDGNQQITIVDISRVSTDYGGTSSQTDLNGNGSVDIVDISLVSTNYGQSGPTNW